MVEKLIDQRMVVINQLMLSALLTSWCNEQFVQRQGYTNGWTEEAICSSFTPQSMKHTQFVEN